MLVVFFSFVQLDITLIQLAISVNPVLLDITATAQMDAWNVQMVLTAWKDQHYAQIVLQDTGKFFMLDVVNFSVSFLCSKYSGNVFCE